MCAMMPMLRTLVRSVRTSCATGTVRALSWGVQLQCLNRSTPDRPVSCHRPRPRTKTGPRPDEVVGPLRLPAVVSERAVRLSHLVRVLATLHRGAEAVRGVEDLVGEALRHRLLATGLGVA